jgi:hypothetical protein
MGIYEDWQDGDLTDMEALRFLAGDLCEVEDVYERATAMRETVRNQIAHIVAHLGDDRVTSGGYVFQLTRPSVSYSYDTKALGNLVLELMLSGNPAAQRISALRKQSERAGSLRVTKEKV